MQLFYSPGASSLAPHILLRQTGLPGELVKVNIRTGKLADGGDFTQINPLGAVPVLVLDNGERLTECAVILQYLGDQTNDRELMPAAGTRERYQQMSWLNFIATEVHKGFSALFNPKMPDEAKVIARENLGKRFGYLAGVLDQQNFLMGNAFSAADAYLFTCLRWCEHCGVPLSQWPVMAAYRDRIAALPAVQAAMEFEGLRK